MDPFLWLVGFVIFAESAFFLGILFVLAFYGWRLLRHIWQGTAFTAYHIENEILYIHNVFETSCPLSDIERVEARKVLLYRRPLSGGAKYFIRLYRKNGRKTGMIIWREGFKRQNYESAEEKVKEFFQLMESRGIPCRMMDGIGFSMYKRNRRCIFGMNFTDAVKRYRHGKKG